MPATERHWIEAYGRVALTGEPAYFENEAKELGKRFEVAAFSPLPNQFACIFVDITDRRRAEEERATLHAQLIQAQKLESIGRLAGGVAHDFNNMLSVIIGNTEMALESVTPGDPIEGDLREIEKAALRSADLTKQLLAFARKQTVNPVVLDLNTSVESALAMLRRLIGENITLVWTPNPDIGPIRVDPAQIAQILANLCVNARDAIDGVGSLRILTDAVTFDNAFCAEHPGSVPGRYVRLSVADDGCGMDQETLSHVFEPFFTTKETGKGTGLGLATVYGAVKQNDGYVRVTSEVGVGTTFDIYLPLDDGAPEASAAGGDPKSADRGMETILVVEDEASILDMTVRMLRRLGYSVLSASGPGDALDLVRTHPGHIDLVVTDVVMPEMDGPTLVATLSSMRPGLKCLFMSGYPANAVTPDGVLVEGVGLIQKPFSMLELAGALREALGDVVG